MNPIRTSDLYKDTGELDKLIADLEAVQAGFEELRKKEVEGARKLETQIRKLTGAVSDERESLEGASRQADEIRKRYDRYTESLNENAVKIAALKNAQRQLNQVNKLEAKLLVEKEGSYNRLSAQYSLNKLRLNQLTSEERKATREGRKLERQTREIYEEMKRLQEATGKNVLSVGDYGIAAQRLTRTLSGLAAGFLSVAAAERAVDVIGDQTKELDALNLAYSKTIANEAERAQTLDFLSSLTDRYGVELLSTRRAYLRFNAAIGETNLSLDQQQQIFESVTKASAALGLDAAKTDRVFNALEQMLSKGVVSSEELRQQLGDSLPGSLNIMAAALGVSTRELSDMLKAGEVLAEDALPKFAAQLEKTYGIESLERIDSVTAAQGRYRSEITRAIEKLEASDAFRDFYNLLADGVKFLSDNGKAILNLGKAVVIAGTAYLTWRTSMLLANRAQAAGIALTLRDITAKRALAATTLLSKRAFDALKIAIATNPIGAIATVILAAVSALALFNRNLDETASLTADVFADAQKAVVEEKIAIEQLVSVARDETRSREERVSAIEKLNQISPDYLGNIDLETIKTKEATVAIDSYIRSLEHQARVKAAQDALVELEKQRIEEVTQGLDRQTSTWGKLGRAILSGGNASVMVGREIEASNRKAAESEQEYLNRKEALLGIIGDQIQLEDALADSRGGSNTDTNTGGGAASSFDPFRAEELRISAMEDGVEKELDLLALNFEKRKIEFEKYGVDVTLLEEQFARDRTAIQDKFAAAEQARLKKLTDAYLKGLDEGREKEERLRRERYNAALDEFDQRQALAASEFALTESTEREKTVFRLSAERDRLQKIIDLNKEFAGELTATQIQTMKNQIQALNNEIANAGVGGGSSDRFEDILDVFGLKLDDDKKQAIQSAASFLKGVFSDLAQTRMRAAQEASRAADAEVAAAQRTLQAEIDNRNAGQAHRVEIAERDLQTARQQQQRALEEQRKAQQAQNRLQAIEQTQSLVTASANIWRSFSPLGPLGVIGAIGAIGTMFGTFIAARLRAGRLARREFSEGGLEILGGGTHKSGNDTFLGFHDNEGRRAYGERGEAHAILPPDATRKYKPILGGLVDSLRNKTFEKLYVKRSEAVYRSDVNVNVPDGGMGSVEDDISAMRRNSEEQYFKDGQGRLVRRRKNVTTVYV